MLVKVGHKKSVEIHDDVIRGVLSVYPEEKLISRPFFEESFATGTMSFNGLLKECEAIIIPWQSFFLNPTNFTQQKQNIEKNRSNKLSSKFFAKRSGVGKITSKRIIDRLIRLQNFITGSYKLPKNGFCGLLKALKTKDCPKKLTDFFGIDTTKFGSHSAQMVMKHIIEAVEAKTINVSRGVLRGGILPEVKGVNEVYKNTSGFVIKDDHIPFIFLPDEINPDEVIGRRIYTLIYLLVCIGLDDYDFYIESEFKASALKETGNDSKKHTIVAGILLPVEHTDKLKGAEITKDTISNLASVFKITPTAVVVTLKRRGVITKHQYEALLPDPYKPQKMPPTPRNPAKITTSVEKFCGQTAFGLVNTSIKSKTVQSIEAQYLIFGGVKKAKYKEYCKLIGA
ncbi:MAG: hypothetical protein KBC12_00780 [Candidatus Pacebacteria bacterium]|jgi:hypothetical protein|nr:hypothetical protein [Candidatus Paceibacterota bacterium]